MEGGEEVKIGLDLTDKNTKLFFFFAVIMPEDGTTFYNLSI